MLIIIHKAMKDYMPDQLAVIGGNNSHTSYYDLFQNDPSLLGKVVKEYGLSNKIKVNHFENNIRKNSNKKVKFIPSFFKKIIFELQLLVYPVVNHDKHVLLATSDTYNMPSFLNKVASHIKKAKLVYFGIERTRLKLHFKEMLLGKSFPFFFLPSNINASGINIFKKKHDKCIEEITSWLKASLNKQFSYGVNLTEILSAFMKSRLRQEMIHLYGKIDSLNRVLSVVQPKQVFSQHSLGVGYALGELCQINSIPGLLITHGSHIPHDDAIAKIEWSIHSHTIFNSCYPFVAFQTPWAKKFFQEQQGTVSKGIVTGPLLLAGKSTKKEGKKELKEKLLSDYKNRQIILHASTPKDWRFFRPWIYETVDEYIRNINDLIRVVDQLSGVYLVVRFRPQKNLTLDVLKNSLITSSNYGVYADGSFEEYLLTADLLVSYSSTTIEESLQNHVPVLQYDPDGKYEHIPGTHLSDDRKKSVSTVYSVFSKKDLYYAMSWWKLHHTEQKNDDLDWEEHSFNLDNQMGWLTTMGIQC